MNSQINDQQNATTKKTEITIFVNEVRKFQTLLCVTSLAPKPNEKGTMGQLFLVYQILNGASMTAENRVYNMPEYGFISDPYTGKCRIRGNFILIYFTH